MDTNLEDFNDHLTHHLFLNVGLKRVWETLTQADLFKQYMFGTIMKTNWQIGSPIEFYLPFENNLKLIVKGEIIKFEFPFKLSYTLIPTTVDIADEPQNYIYTQFDIKPSGNQTKLTITQRGFKNAQNGLARYKEAEQSWATVLPKLKNIAEM